MFFSIIVGLMVLLVAMFAIRQGFFSSFIMLVESVAACLLAFTFYETVYGFVSGSIGPGIGEPLSLMLIFAATLFLLRLITEKLITGNVHMIKYIDWGGAGLCGLFTGLILVGTAVIAVQMLPIGSDVLGFERFAVNQKNSRPEADNFVFKPDRFVAGMLDMFSNGRFGTDAAHRFAYLKPNLIDTLYSRRCVVQVGLNEIVPENSVSVLEWWDERKIDHVTHEAAGDTITRSFQTEEADPRSKFLVCRVLVRDKAANDLTHDIRFRLPQFRIIGATGRETKRSPKALPEVHLAVGMSDLYSNDKQNLPAVLPLQVGRLVRFGSQTSFILKPGITDAAGVSEAGTDGAEITGYKFDVAFEVPEQFKPWYLEFKRGTRFEFREKFPPFRAEPPDHASKAFGGGDAAVAAAGGGRGSQQIGRAPGGRVHIANAIAERTGVSAALPVALDGNNSAMFNYLGGGRKFSGGSTGHMLIETPAGEIEEAARITEFLVPSDKRLLQVGAQQMQAGSILGRALGFASSVVGQIYITDTEGKEYFAIGVYAEAPAEGKRWLEIQYYPEALVPERCLKKAKKLTKSVWLAADPDDRILAYLFLVPPGKTITSFHAGARSGQSQPLNIEVPSE